MVMVVVYVYIFKYIHAYVYMMYLCVCLVLEQLQPLDTVPDSDVKTLNPKPYGFIRVCTTRNVEVAEVCKHTAVQPRHRYTIGAQIKMGGLFLGSFFFGGGSFFLLFLGFS